MLGKSILLKLIILQAFFLMPQAFAGATIDQFVGDWRNVDPETKGMIRLEVTKNSESEATLHGYESCSPTCDWGTTYATISGDSLVGVYTFSDKMMTMVLTKNGTRIDVKRVNERTGVILGREEEQLAKAGEIETGVFDFSFSPPGPARLKLGQKLNISFNYIHNQPSGIKIFFDPISNTGTVDSYGRPGVAVYSEKSGMANTFLSIHGDHETHIDELIIRILDTDNNELVRSNIPVSYTFTVPDSIWDVQFDPESPAVLDTNRIDIKFKYFASEKDVVVYFLPYRDGEQNRDLTYTFSPYYSSGNGSGTASLLFSPGFSEVDSVYYIMLDSAQTDTLVQGFIPVDYKHGTPTTKLKENSLKENSPGTGALHVNHTANMLSNGNLFLRYFLPVSGRVGLKLFDIEGRLLGNITSKWQGAGSQHLEITPRHALNRGHFFVSLRLDDQILEKKILVIR